MPSHRLWAWLLASIAATLASSLAAPMYCGLGCLASSAPFPTPAWVHGLIEVVLAIALLRPLRVLVLVAAAMLILGAGPKRRELALVALGLYVPSLAGSLLVIVPAIASVKLLLSYFYPLSTIYNIAIITGYLVGVATGIRIIARSRGLYKSWKRSLAGAASVLLGAGFARILVEAMLSPINMLIYTCSCQVRGTVINIYGYEIRNAPWSAISVASLAASFIHALVFLALLGMLVARQD